jgi:hypothetical protein
MVGSPAAHLKNQAGAMAQTKPPIHLPRLNPIDAINPIQLSVKEVKEALPNPYPSNGQTVAANSELSVAPTHYGKNPQNGPADSGGLKLTGANWIWVYDNLNSAIKVRHYSPKTLQAYRFWTQKFQAFAKSKDARLLAMEDVKGFFELSCRR